MQALSKIPLETAKEANYPQMQRYKCSKRGWKDVGAMANLKDPPGQLIELEGWGDSNQKLTLGQEAPQNSLQPYNMTNWENTASTNSLPPSSSQTRAVQFQLV
jgi:hypothetical protein